jgi:hypothetical protein
MIHDQLEKYYSNVDVPVAYQQLCETVDLKLKEVCSSEGGAWVSEKAFAHHSGYGGKVDLHNDEWVVDFKTKEFPDQPNVKKMVYDDYGTQLAAYAQGLGSGRRLLNVFIDVGSPRVLVWEHEDVNRFQTMFNHALSLWKLVKKYNPEWHDRRVM